MEEKKKIKLKYTSKISDVAISWIGSLSSLVVHTLIFIGSFVIVLLGTPLEKVLLVLTTAVSLEAIYLAIFIQMTVNKNTQSLEEVEEDIDEIQEDVGEIEKDVDEIQKDVDDIQEDVDEIQKDVDDIDTDDNEHLVHDQKTQDVLLKIQGELQKLMKEIEDIKKEKE
jgi:uncharacterized protein YoxC